MKNDIFLWQELCCCSNGKQTTVGPTNLQCCALRDRKINFCVYYLFSLYRCMQLLQVIYENDQYILLNILDIIIQYHMIVTWHTVAKIRGGSKINFRHSISTNVWVKVQNCNKGISTIIVNFESYHHLATPSRFWNTSPNSSFGVAILLGIENEQSCELSSQISPLVSQYFIFSLSIYLEYAPKQTAMQRLFPSQTAAFWRPSWKIMTFWCVVAAPLMTSDVKCSDDVALHLRYVTCH